MNMGRNHRTNEGAFAMVATLSLFLILTAMIAVILRSNASTRMHLKSRRNHMMALCLAESGVEEALHAIGSGRGRVAHLTGAVGRGGFEVTWQAVEGMPGVYEIISTGFVRPDDNIARKRLCVRAAVADRDSPPPSPVRVLAWTPQ